MHLRTVIETIEGRERATRIDSQEFDLSDAAIVAQAIESIEQFASGRLESLRQQFSAQGLATLMDYYWQLESWDKKALLIVLVDCSLRSMLQPILADAVNHMPYSGDDDCRWALASAICYLLHGNRDRFSTYYNDDEVLLAAIAQYQSGSSNLPA